MKSRRTDTAIVRAVSPSGPSSSTAIAPSPNPNPVSPHPVSAVVEPHHLSLHHDTLIPLIIWRQRAPVLACAVLGMVAAAFYVHFGTPLWLTEARIIARTTPLTTDSQSAAMSDTFLNTQCELIRSSPILALAISNVDADNLALFRDVHNRISYLKKNLEVDVAKHSDIIEVDLESPYPDDATKLVDAVVNAYQDFQRRQALSADGQLLSILQHEKDKRDTELDAKTAALDDLRVSENAVAVGGDNSITMQRLSTLSSALTAAQLDTVAAKSAYEQTAKSAGIDTTDPNWIAKNQADVSERNLANGVGDEASIRAQLFDLQQQMSVLQRQYLPGHPAIQALQSHIDQLTRAIVVWARDRWLTAQSREQALQASYDAQQKVAFAQNARNGEAARLASDIKRLQDLSDSLDKRIKELSLTSQAGTFNIQMVDQATNSDDPVFPQAKFILPIGLLAGALAGVVLGLIRETSGFSINLKTLGGSGRKSMMGLPVFASVPRQAEVSIKHVAWSSHLRPESTIAVAFRKLRDALQAAAASDETLTAARTILVASPMNGEGRSIAASNLAITLAKSGKRVCLVDADLRLPSLARIYAVRDDSGLTNVVTGLDPLTKALQRTVIERLDLLPAGPPVDDPAELLNSPQFVETLEDLTMKYDHVVVDSPSVLGAPDARIIAASCDATLLLLSQEGVSKKVAEQCRDGLQSVGAHVIGILMNSAPKRAQRGRDDRNDTGRSVRKQTLPDSPRSDIPQLPLRARA